MTGYPYCDRDAPIRDRGSKHDPEKIGYIVDLLELNGGEDILYVATGTGILIPLLEGHDPKSVSAIGISGNTVGEAEKRCPAGKHPEVRFETKDICDLDDVERYDRAICMAAFPHFDDRGRAVEIMADALRGNGILVMAHPASEERMTGMHPMHDGDAADPALPDDGELRRMFEGNGLKVTSERDDGGYHLIVGKKEPETFSEDEMYKILMTEFEEFKDEGKDLYMDELIGKMRERLGTE